MQKLPIISKYFKFTKIFGGSWYISLVTKKKLHYYDEIIGYLCIYGATLTEQQKQINLEIYMRIHN